MRLLSLILRSWLLTLSIKQQQKTNILFTGNYLNLSLPNSLDMRQRKMEEQSLISKIGRLCDLLPNNISRNEKDELPVLYDQLDNLYLMRARGAYVRSRTQWLEEGEQSMAYLFSAGTV